MSWEPEKLVRKIGFTSFVFIIAMIVMVILLTTDEWKRDSRREPFAIKARELVSHAQGYESQRSWYDNHVEKTVQSAYRLSEIHTAENGRTYESFNESLFLPYFFRELIAVALNEERTDIVDALSALRDAKGIRHPFIKSQD